MARTCMHGYVSGRVQGVCFRQTTAEQAERLDLDGWVRNLADGRVEVLFEGDETAVAELTSWLQHGPQAAEVTALELQDQTLQGIAGLSCGAEWRQGLTYQKSCQKPTTLAE